MKINKILLLISALMILLTNVALAFTVNGSGNIISEKRPVSGFQHVSIEESGRLYIQQGETDSLEIEADDNILQRITSKVSGKTLTISHKMFYSFRPSKPIVYRLSLKTLSSLKSSGSLYVHSFHLNAEHLVINISGSAKVEIDQLEGESLDLGISGSGEVAIKNGRVKKQKISISGSGNYQSKNVRSEDISLNVSGSGSLEIWVTDKLNASLSGCGSVSYYGSPHISRKISGSGKLNSLGNK